MPSKPFLTIELLPEAIICHVSSRSSPTHWLQSRRGVAVVDGVSAISAAARYRADSASAARPGVVHGGLAREQLRHYTARLARTGCDAMGECLTSRRLDFGCQHHGLLLAAASRSLASVGHRKVAAAQSAGTNPSLSLIPALLVSGCRRAAHLDGKLPADADEALFLRAAVRSLDRLLAHHCCHH